jgi:hypothetical protein
MLLRTLVGVPLLVACARSSDRPAEQRPPVVVLPAPEATPSGDVTESLPGRQPRSSEPEARGSEEHGHPRKQGQVKVTGDGGVFSFSARAVRDGGFSFRFSASLSLGNDGGSMSVTISPDAGAP